MAIHIGLPVRQHGDRQRHIRPFRRLERLLVGQHLALWSLPPLPSGPPTARQRPLVYQATAPNLAADVLTIIPSRCTLAAGGSEPREADERNPQGRAELVARFFDVLLWPLVFLSGVIGAILRTVYWSLVVTPAVTIVALLVGVGSIPKPVVPVLVALGGRDLHRSLG